MTSESCRDVYTFTDFNYNVEKECHTALSTLNSELSANEPLKIE